MAELFPLFRTGPQVQTLRHRFEKAGQVVDGEAIPWGAEAILVDALVFLPSAFASRMPADFPLRLDGTREQHFPEALSLQPRGGLRLLYRLPVPAQTASAEVFYRHRSLGQIALPIVSPAEFSRNLHLEHVTLSACLAPATVCCQSYVGGQCQGLVSSALVRQGKYSLLPLLDLGLSVTLTGPGQSGQRFPACLSSSQLVTRDALVSVLLPRPRRLGDWTVNWHLGDVPLARQQIHGLSKPRFLRSLRLASARFVAVDAEGKMRLSTGMPGRQRGVRRIGPCFLVESVEPGMAGAVTLRVTARLRGTGESSLLAEREIVITDGPQPMLPGTLDVGELEGVEAFELYSPRGLLGKLPLQIPTASFTGEGGFKPSDDFTWSDAAEEELRQKLTGLLGS